MKKHWERAILIITIQKKLIEKYTYELDKMKENEKVELFKKNMEEYCNNNFKEFLLKDYFTL